jgi:hypothetical protein
MFSAYPRDTIMRVEGGCMDVIQASKPELRIMRYELTDYEWVAIKPMLPHKPRGVPRVRAGTHRIRPVRRTLASSRERRPGKLLLRGTFWGMNGRREQPKMPTRGLNKTR